MEALTRSDALHGLVLVRDSIFAEAGHRVVPTVLQKLLLTDDVSVLVVTSRHSTSHYTMLLRRLNIHLSKIGAAGRFRVLNTNSLCRLDVAADRYNLSMNELMKAVMCDVKGLAAGVDGSGGERPLRCVVLFDDLIALLNASKDHPMTVCRAIAGLQSGVMCRIVVAHEDVEGWDEVVSTLSAEAATVVRPPLQGSGCATESDASFSVLRRKFLARQETVPVFDSSKT